MPTKTVSTRLESADLRQLEALEESKDLDRATLVRTLLKRGMRDMRLELGVDAYRAEKVTLGRAAEIAGLGTWDFLALMADKHLELHYGVEDLESDLAQETR